MNKDEVDQQLGDIARKPPETFIVSYGDTCWLLDDGAVGRPIMGAGPFIKFFQSYQEAQEGIDQILQTGFFEDEFAILHVGGALATLR